MNLKKIRIHIQMEKIMVAAVILISALFVVMQSTQNPWSVHMPHLDSAVWISRAVSMKSGQMIYLDVWDHKGPLLFLIQYLGLSITPHSLTGVWILEWVFLAFSGWFLFKTARLLTDSNLVAVLSVMLSFEPFQYYFQKGNCVEAWALPFMSISLYIFMKFLITGNLYEKEVVAAGLCMACSFLLNGNLVSAWITFLPVILIYLVIKEDVRKIGKCILPFLTGIFAVLLPIFIWLLVKGAGGAFLNAYFLFNASYTGSVTISKFYSSVMKFLYMDGYFIWLHIGCFMILFHRKKWLPEWLAFLYTIISLGMLSMSGRGYFHYGIQLIPCMIIPAVVCINGAYKWLGNNRRLAMMAIIIFLAWGRFDVENTWENIKWTMDESAVNYDACGKFEDYKTINDWTGRWSDEELEKKVVEYLGD